MKFTVDPTDNDKLGEGDDHQGEGRAVPVHDLQEVDSTLQQEITTVKCAKTASAFLSFRYAQFN